ncbi:MAG TPA: M1 family aminopeptidase [Bryobacteraceae bacterium]|jgi:tetratricopeptide (TPR) repeat protein|nr:M1 family aminopeptidase [Bryobacteraceae bacterium]
MRKILLAILATTSLLVAQDKGGKRARIDVENYVVDADINPHTQALTANVKIRFVPLDNDISSVSFELNNALNVSRVVDETGRQIPASRSTQDFSVQLTFPAPLTKGKATTLTFSYDGRLTGQEESPVYGIKFADIQNDYAYLMYPSRWFPINDYTIDRYTADLHITVPSGFKVIASGLESSNPAAAGKVTYGFQYTKPSFPGSIAIVQGEPVRVNSQGVTTSIYFRQRQSMANAYGEEAGKVMTFLSGTYGLAPQANLTLVETEDGTPNGYSAPGIIFLSPHGIGGQVASRMLVNQMARQWWETLVSPINRDHMWLENGNARFAELLWEEHNNGPGAVDQSLHDTYVEALTVDNPPLIQAGRLEDYSPEYWASTAGKGAAILNMLRSVMGNDGFAKLMNKFPEQHAWQSVSTADFRKTAEEIYGQSLQYFFLQWIESSGAPEFKLEYTVFRTQKGFRVMGKISQDLDTFHMPVDLKIETEGNPETKRVDVVGTTSEFTVDTFGKPKQVTIDPSGAVLRWGPPMRVAVAIKKGEQYAEIGEFGDALKEYQKALEVSHGSSLAHYRVAEIFFLQNNYQSAANEFRESLNGDLDPKWTEVWAHIKLGNIFDVSGQRDRAVNEYNLAIRTRDNTQGAQEEAAKYLKAPYERKRSNV